jgi:hypothetical protein
MADGQQNLDVLSRLKEAGIKEQEKIVKEKTREEFTQKEQQRNILQGLLGSMSQQGGQPSGLESVKSLSKEQIPTGEKKSRIGNFIRGEGFKQSAVTEDLGIDNAIKVLNLQQTTQQNALGTPKKAIENIQALVELVSDDALGLSREQAGPILNSVKQLLGVVTEGQGELEKEELERDLQGRLTAPGIVAEAKAKGEGAVEAKKLETQQKSEEKNVESLKAINTFTIGFERAEEEIERVLGKEAFATGIKGKATRLRGDLIDKNLDRLPISSAFSKNIEATANGMARNIEGGKITNEDREIYAKTLANSLKSPREENAELLATQLLGFRDKDGADISSQLNAFKNSKSKTLNRIFEVFEEIDSRKSGDKSPKSKAMSILDKIKARRGK